MEEKKKKKSTPLLNTLDMERRINAPTQALFHAVCNITNTSNEAITGAPGTLYNSPMYIENGCRRVCMCVPVFVCMHIQL